MAFLKGGFGADGDRDDVDDGDDHGACVSEDDNDYKHNLIKSSKVNKVKPR